MEKNRKKFFNKYWKSCLGADLLGREVYLNWLYGL